jgi:threonine dehydrogenase-like Zn-dependent dehydrogenase
MNAVVFHGIGDIRFESVSDPGIQEPTDAIVRISSSAICGTDLHFVRGTAPGMEPGTILGHEAVGVVEEVGKAVRNIRPGDRVVVASTIGCGYCSYCRDGYFAQCDNANPNGARAGTCFFGGPATTGPIQGLQAEYARVPFANVGLVRLLEGLTDDQAILLSDIFPTGYFGADIAEIRHGDTVAVFGCGPVGLFTIASAFYMGAGRVVAIDNLPDRLEAAQRLGAEIIHFDKEDPVEVILEMTGGIGVDRAIDAVGVDAEPPHHGPAAKGVPKKEFKEEVKQVAPKTNPEGEHWVPGAAPSQAVRWAVEGLAKAGTLAIIGFYPPTMTSFPFGAATQKNLTIQTGNCNHRRYIPKLQGLLRSGAVNLDFILSHEEPLPSAVEAYKHFDARHAGWLKVELKP